MTDEITTTFYSRTQEKCDTEANWEAANPVLLKNEVIYIKTADGDTRTKTGDGTSRYKSLPFNDKNFRDSLPIKSLAGQKVKPTSDTEVTAAEGATIIGDLRERTYSSGIYVSKGNVASGEYSVALGKGATARGDYSVAMGDRCIASGTTAFAMGGQCVSSGWSSVAIGGSAQASGNHAVSIGHSCEAKGDMSIASGYTNYANGRCSASIGGYNNWSTGDFSFVTGKNNLGLAYQFKIGQNAKDGTAGASSSTGGDAFIIGNGTSDHSNAFRVTYAGKAYGLSAYGSSGADYAEYFEWKDGNPDNEDRRGRLVTLDGEKIRFATADDDYILGIISANPCVEGDIQPDDWQGKYLTDVFGQRLTKTVHIPDRYEEHETIDTETGETKTESILIEKEHDAVQWIINPDYDQNKEYVSREDRPEWAPVGMMGKLVVVDDGTCEVNGFCKAGINGIATKADNGYRVMKRIDETHILVLVR